MIDLVVDRGVLDDFLSVLPPLSDGYVYLLSLSVRNKYLDAEERARYSLSKTEMFGRTIVKDLDDFDFYLKKLASHLEYKRTRTGLEFPVKAMVIYLMINPSSMVSAYTVFQERMNRFLQEMFRAQENGSKMNLYDMENMDHHLLTSVGKALRRRDFIDIDLDCDDEKILEEILADLHGSICHVVKTQGGYHLLLPREQKPFPRVHEILTRVKKEHPEIKEVCFNKNAMIPLPGTLQAGKLVGFRKGGS